MTSRTKLPMLGLALVATLTIASSLAGEESKHPAMQDPAKANETAPATFTAKFETTKGDIEFECTRDWAPHGVDRFYNLAKIGFFNDVAFFRVIKGFMAQFGIHGNPDVSKKWKSANLKVDPVKQSNTKGMLTYAMAGSPTTRSTQLYINYGNNARLDAQGFAPICKVSKGMDIAEKLYNEYADKPSSHQGDIQEKGNAYLKEAWPELDYIVKSSIVKEGEKTVLPDKPEPNKGSSSVLPDAEEKSDTSTYIIVGLLAAGALLAFMFTRKEEEEEPAPAPKKKASKKTSSSKTSSSKTVGTKKKKTTKKKKRTKKASKPAD